MPNLLFYYDYQIIHQTVLTRKATKTVCIANSHAPFRTRHTKLRNAPWINSALKKGMRCRDAAKRKAIRTKNPQDCQLQKVTKSIQQ